VDGKILKYGYIACALLAMFSVPFLIKRIEFIYIYIYIYIYVPDFGRMFLKLKYTDITKNTHIRN